MSGSSGSIAQPPSSGDPTRSAAPSVSARESRSLALPRRLAIGTTCATFVLLLIGGLVHNTRSSLACPDWPLCFGSAFPKMVGGVFYEHSHRLAATTVGLLTIALLVVLARRGRRWGLRGAIALALVVAQGVLGGITVLFKLPPAVSTTHLGVSLIFFCYLIWLSAALRAPDSPPRPTLSPRLRRALAATAVAAWLQCVLGALMRHLGAGMACGFDIPWCKGALWPSSESFYVQLHAAHRLVGVALAIAVMIVALRVSSKLSGGLRAAAIALPLIVLAQVGLGIWSVLSFLDALPVTAHLGGAAATLGLLAALRFATAPAAVPAAALSAATAPDGGEVAAT